MKKVVRILFVVAIIAGVAATAYVKLRPVAKASDAVKTGMTANLVIVVDEAQDALVVPTRAIKTINKQKYVTLLDNGEEVQTPVETGLSANSMTEIVKGLQEGDVVVVTASGATSSNTNMGPGFGPMDGGMPPMGVQGGPPPGGN